MAPSKLQLPEIPERYKRPLAYAGYPLFALLVFILAVHLSLPRERIQEQLLSGFSESLGADVTCNQFALSILPPPAVKAKGVIVVPRPVPGAPPVLGPDGKPEKPAQYPIDDVKLSFDTWQLLHGFSDTTFRGHAAQGVVSGRWASLPDKATLELDVSGLQIGAVPSLAAALGLTGVPLAGEVALKGEAVASQNLYAQTDGSFELTLNSVQLGDGKAKLIVPGNVYLAAGITVPTIKLGQIAGSATIVKGRLQLHDLKAHSPDMDLELDGFIDLRDPVSFSVIHLYLKVKPSEALLKREAALEVMVNVAGPPARRSDGYYGIEITGTPNSPIVRASANPPPALNLKPLPPPRPTPMPFGRPPFGSPPVPLPSPPTATPPPPLPPSPAAPPPAPPPGEPPSSAPTPVAPPSATAPPPGEAQPSSIAPPSARFGAGLRPIGVSAPIVPAEEHPAPEAAGDAKE